jgi:tetratricopeptide (TPR) repeat protein
MSRDCVEGKAVSRIHAFSLRAFLERFQDEPRLRQRVVALAGFCLLVCGIFVAVGLGRLILAALGVVAVASLVAGLVWAARRRDLVQIVRTALPEAERVRRQVSVISRQARIRGGVAAQRVRALRPPERARAPAPQRSAPQRSAPQLSAPQRSAPQLNDEESYGWPYAGAERSAAAPNRPAPRVDVERRRAVQLNARGAQLRRDGSHTPAVELHLEALAIFETLDDPHAQASTLNGLALALKAAGDIDGAVARFEQALTILRGSADRAGADDPEQAKVIANLGFTLLKQGVEGRGRELLSEALEKLPPESPAAQQVEAQLRRAS